MSFDCLLVLLSLVLFAGLLESLASNVLDWRMCEAAHSGEARDELPDTVTGRSKNGEDEGEKERVLDTGQRWQPAGLASKSLKRATNRHPVP